MKALKTWLIASAALAAAMFALLAFFVFSRYSFVYNHALLLVFTLSCVSLVVSFTAWLCRKCKRGGAKAAAAIFCMLVCLAGLFAHNTIAIVFLPRSPRQIETRAQLIRLWLPRPDVRHSPEGTNSVIVLSADPFDEAIAAFPMVNRWMFERQGGGIIMLGRSWRAYTVTWETEYRAVVQGPDDYFEDDWPNLIEIHFDE